ncbi:ebhA protein [Gardnerella pickettii 00703Bmash]|uniref:FIVAR domain-containing protein n=1 Tax=Gardnerella pickettii TaxID=2914924 RepID=UPI00026359E3|nr:FIVAR domain-containing protein [Gardnerella pickettii]EIK83477.1 ebhA protein [Gardnerella pickettii 00703Bmash]
MTTKSGKHANKIAKNAFDSAANNGVIKAVDMRKVAALSAGAAGVIAGAAIAFGATPAMAAEAPTSTPVNPSAPANTQDVTANNDDSKKKAGEKQQADNQNKQTEVKKQADQTVAKADNTEGKTDKETTDNAPAPNSVTSKVSTYAASSAPAEVTTGSNNGTDRSATPAPATQVKSEITLSKETKDTLPNMYAWGSADNTYIENGQNTSVKITLKSADGIAVTKVAIFPNDNIDINGRNAKDFVEYKTGDENAHQPYSGEYAFATNNDGSATLTVNKLYRNNNMAAAGYAANRCIYVYGTKDGQEVLLYKTNIARAATLIPPKKTGSFVLRYDQKLEDKTIREKLQEALDAPTAGKDGKSLRDQIQVASTAKGVGVRDKDNEKKLDTTPDTAENKVIINAEQAYDANQLATVINKETSKSGEPKTYVTGVYNLKTYLISDLGYKSDVLPLTIARYDTRIDKPTVEDLSQVSEEVKTDIKKKLARLNHVSEDKVTINDDNTVTINFTGVDAADAPKIPLRELVLKKIAEADVTVPTGDKATFVYNPLAYSDAEIKSIKQAIFEANKANKDLGLTSVDQISLSYLTGNLTASGHANQGISNGRQENAITVKIKTDKAVAEFKSDITKSKLTKFVNIREDYDVTWNNNKIDGRDSDEGLSWSEDHKTIIYRYDPTKAVAFKSGDVTKLLTATPKAGKEGLRTLTGGEKLDHEGAPGQEKKSHVGYILQNGQPTGELTLGIMKSGYWTGDPQITGTDVNMGDVLAKADSYTWNDGAEPVKVASKDGKIYRARLFVAPYGMESYQYVYTHPDGKNPNNTSKAINVIFVPQTNHKTKDLSDSIGEHKTENVEGKDVPTQSKYYNASADKKEAYEKALKTATDLLATVKDKQEKDLTEEQKAQIDNATINLNKARAELDGADTNKDKLNDSIDANGKAAEGTTAATGTQATNQFKNVSDPDFKKADGSDDKDRNEAAKKAKTDYDKALEEANKVKEDKNATQKAVDDAKAKLDAAREKLNDFTTNKDELNNAIAQHGKVNTGDAKKTDPAEKLKTADPTYQNSSETERKAYDEAVTQANKVVADPNASQKEVNEAIKKLKEAKEALDKNATDKAPLAAAVQKSFDNPDPNDATKQSVFYKNAKAKADNDNDGAARDAINNYDQALAKAKQVLADDKATKKDVEDAKKALEDAEKALHADTYATDNKSLGEALADNFSGYLMPAYFNAFDKAQAGDEQAKKDFKAYNDAYHAAKDLMAKTKQQGSTVTQDKVDKVKAQLLEARKVIDKYATDTSKISAALLQSLAITNSPAYKNASANTDPNSDEAKAKKAYDDALKELQKAFNDQMDKDKGDDGNEIPESVIPDKDIDMTNKDALKKLQAHAKGQPLNRDVTKLLAKLNDAVKGLDTFKTKTDELIKSINEDDNTKQTPAYKNTENPDYKGEDGTTADTDKNGKASAARTAYDDALKAAKELLKKPDATQKEINDAKAALDNARKALDAYNTDTTKLKDSVDKHGSTEGPAPTEGTQTSDAYRNASDPHFLTADGKPDTDKNAKAAAAKKAYDEALTKAQELLKKHDDKATPQDAKPTQKEIDEALKTLDEARKKLEDNYKTVTTDLEKEINKSTPEGAPAVTEDDFENTPEFKNAKAKTSDGNENADVTAYKEALKKARNLVKAAADQDKKNSSHPTQKQINDALDALKAAKKQITDNYKTNLEPLTSAKDFADDGFKKTPEYKNALAKKTAGDPGATNDLGETGKDTGFDNILKKVTEKLNDEDWKKKATQKDVNALLKQLKDAQDNIAKKYKTDAIKLEREVGDKDQDGKPVTPPFEASVAYKNALEKAKTEEDKTGNDSATKKLEAYNEKLKAAQELLNKVNHPDPNAKPEDRPTQKQVDDALAALKKAKKDIDDNFKTKVDALKKETKELKDDGGAKPDTEKFEKSTEFKNASAKTDADSKKDVQTYKDALKKANDLLGKFDENGKPKSDAKDIPTQQEVDAAKKALKEIKDKILANYKTNPHDLQEEVDNSKDGDEDKRDTTFENTPEYQNATAKGDEAAQKALKDYNDKLDAARKLLGAFNRNDGKVKDKLPDGMTKAPTQKELDDALDALQAAKKKITDGYKTNPSKLKSEADKDGDFTKTPEYVNAQAKGDDASKKDLEAYKKALEDANKVLGDKNATQKQVDDALKKLQDAKSKLTDGYKTDKNKLYQETGNDPEFRKSIPFLIADSKDIAEYNKALNDANAVLADPNATQAQVDEALRKLQAIKQKMIDLYNSLGSGSDDDSDGGSTGANNANANAVDKSMLHAEVNGALADVANGAGAAGAANGAKGSKGALVDASVIKEFNDALENARRVLADPNATQEQVEAATMRLRAARAALNAAKANKGSNLRGNMGVQTGVDSATLSAFAAVFVGLAGLGVSAKRRKHSSR